MNLAFKHVIAVVFLTLNFVAPVVAGSLEDGVAAFDRGNYATATMLLLPLAHQGDAKAQNIIGTMYYEGQSFPVRNDVAAKWYLKSAKQGYRPSQATLGKMYFGGFGVPQNDAKAIKWWRKAATQGDSSSQDSLGIMYEKGSSVPMNLILAYKWHSLSAMRDLNYKLVAKDQLDGIAQRMTPAQI